MEKEEKAAPGPVSEFNDDVKRKIKKLILFKLKEQGISEEPGIPE
jgi:hypothetical protein